MSSHTPRNPSSPQVIRLSRIQTVARRAQNYCLLHSPFAFGFNFVLLKTLWRKKYTLEALSNGGAVDGSHVASFCVN
jgi:hypothetical protein